MSSMSAKEVEYVCSSLERIKQILIIHGEYTLVEWFIELSQMEISIMFLENSRNNLLDKRDQT